MNRLILQTLKFAHTGIAPKLLMQHNLAKDLWPVVADPGQMKQMLLNIFSNAFEAMANEEEGTLTVSSFNVVKETNWECSFNNIHPQGDYIQIDISNTGPGIPEDIARQIFEPFYTTKSLGRGLGLAAVAGIVQNHGGCVSLSSDAKGTTFHIMLPRAKDGTEMAENESLSRNGLAANLSHFK